MQPIDYFLLAEGRIEPSDMRNPLLQRQGMNERIMLRELLRRVDMMVLLENHLDVLVRLHSTLPPGKIGHAIEPGREDVLLAVASAYEAASKARIPPPAFGPTG